MKKFNKKSNKKQVVKELAEHFQNELDRKLPITVLPGGAAVYKNFLVKQSSNGNWGMYNYRNQTLIEQYFLNGKKIFMLQKGLRQNHRDHQGFV